jgi:serine/threonine protein kinase
MYIQGYQIIQTIGSGNFATTYLVKKNSMYYDKIKQKEGVIPMNQSEINEEQTTEEQQQQELDDQQEQIQQWYNLVLRVLNDEFPEIEVTGTIAEHSVYGYVFAYQLQEGTESYAIGFFLSELIHKFQSNQEPSRWLASFFHDKMSAKTTSLLPTPPETEEEINSLMDQHILPLCYQSIQEEFPNEEIATGLELHEEYGPMLESSFRSIQEGNNTCAIPLMFLYTLYLMNRDPAEPVTQALQQLLDQHQS